MVSAQPRGQGLGRWLVAALAGAVALTVACDDAASPVDLGRRQAFLRSVGPNVFVPTYAAFAREAAALRSALQGWDGQADSADAPRAAFTAAMTAWQQAEVLQAGPAGSSLLYVGGADLRDALYSWPTTNPCRVDQALVDQSYAADDYLRTALVNGYGLDALAHLVFGAADRNACPAQAAINADGTWAALDAATLAGRRAAFAQRLAAHVDETAQALVSAWSPTGGDFAGQLGEAQGFDGVQAGLDQVAWGLFYLDRQLKDVKIAFPAGIDPSCPTDQCPEAVEFPDAPGLSLAALRANLVGFRALFEGHLPGAPEQLGLDDLLADEGATDLVVELRAAMDAADGALAALQGSLAEAVVAQPEAVQALHAATKTLSTLLKTRVVTVLNLTLPQEGAADND